MGFLWPEKPGEHLFPPIHSHGPLTAGLHSPSSQGGRFGRLGRGFYFLPRLFSFLWWCHRTELALGFAMCPEYHPPPAGPGTLMSPPRAPRGAHEHTVRVPFVDPSCRGQAPWTRPAFSCLTTTAGPKSNDPGGTRKPPNKLNKS